LCILGLNGWGSKAMFCGESLLRPPDCNCNLGKWWEVLVDDLTKCQGYWKLFIVHAWAPWSSEHQEEQYGTPIHTGM